MQKEWTWRDSGNHGPLIGAFNLACSLSGYARKRFVAEDFLDRAVAKSGYSDFGDLAFREGLRRLCHSFSADHGLSGLGHFAVREMISDTLTNRLSVVDWYNSHPQVQDEVIKRPWVITGLPRSGTTLGAHLLDLDLKNHSPLLWQCNFPAPPASLAAQYSDPRIAKCEKNMERATKLFPALMAMHPMEARLTQECVSLLQLDFQSSIFHGIALVPEYTDWHIASDLRSSYRLHRQILQMWQAAIPTEHWSLKAPAHMFGIDALMSIYPDARILWSHRDPVVCIASYSSLALNFMRAYNRNIDPKPVADYFARMWFAGVSKMMKHDKASTHESWCKHVYYSDLIEDPVATIASAYSHFGDSLDPIHARKIKAWVEQRPQNTFGKHKYSLDDLGLDSKKINEQFAEYIETYRVPTEQEIRT